MTTKLDVMKATRARILSNLEHRVSTILAFSDSTPPQKLKVTSQLLENAWADLKGANDDLDGHITESTELAAFNQENFTIEDQYIEAKTLLTTLMEDDTESVHSHPRNSFNNSSFDTEFKISRINIKPFSGKYEDWSEFKDIFCSCVKDNPRIPDIQKLHQLKGLLSEEPSKLIKNLKMKDKNFETAWTTLDEHYDNPSKVVWGYLQRFFEIQTISSGTASAQEIQNMLITTSDLLTSLKDFGIDTSSWDTIIIYVLTQKLDSVTLNFWHEERRASKSIPTFVKFKTFLETRQNVCEAKEARRRASISATSTPKPAATKPIVRPMTKALLNQTVAVKCELCEKDHRTFQCPRLINATYDRRLELIRSKSLCENCLYPHETDKCTSRFTCRACSAKHHTLLHPLQTTVQTNLLEQDDEEDDEEEYYDDEEGASSKKMFEQSEVPQQGQSEALNCNHLQAPSSLLATALVPAFTKTGTIILLRALLDQGSEASLITSRAQQMLNTSCTPEHIPITAVGNTPAGIIKHSTSIVIGSLHDKDYRCSVKALVTKSITRVAAQSNPNHSSWEHIRDLPLADPKYFEPGQIDLLLGVREMAELLMPGLVKGIKDAPMAQQTKLGWVLSGTCGIKPSQVKCHSTNIQEANNKLSEVLKSFWALEEIPRASTWSRDEQAAEEHFIKHVRRHTDGKFIVRLPFKLDPSDDNFLGQSRDIAISRFLQVERKLARNEMHYNEYRKCMNEYLQLGHMRPVTNKERNDDQAYFLPHHGVVKESSETTKLRVVFDASCKSSNGKSLNDLLLVGPTIQRDLFTLLTQWRSFEVAFTGDIEKMYRQVWVDDQDAKFQRIIWRDNKSEPLQEFILKTVTFGTASAPFQAIRSLFKIADDITSNEPHIADLIRKNFYVDDFLGSTETVRDAVQIREKLQAIMEIYGFNLRKWKSNSIPFLKDIDPAIQSEDAELVIESPCKALGIFWHPKNDHFYFRIKLDKKETGFTKRQILSETAKIFDPLGWLAPCTVTAKIIMQELWKLAGGWDDRVPIEVETKWQDFRAQLPTCQDIKIPRWINYSSSVTACIHGFADASEKAYAAVVYLVTDNNSKRNVSLLAAKTKVAPLKTISIPRLELSAARLLAELIQTVKTALKIDNIQVVAWSDSEAVLGWLNKPPHHWTTFVANRVAQIQEILPPDQWRYVPTDQNPADCATHGLMPGQIQTHHLWWSGPIFLTKDKEHWPRPYIFDPQEVLPDARKTKKILHTNTNQCELLDRFSSLRTLLHVTAYCFRWRVYKRSNRFSSTLLTVDEINTARRKLLKIAQSQYFANEIRHLRAGRSIPRSSTIAALRPKQDEHGLLRIDGRLSMAKLSRDQKEPIILPKDGPLTGLIIRDAHLRTFHGGNQLTLQRLRQQYWVVQGRTTVKRHISQCLPCFRHRKMTSQQLMGNLPEFRVNEYRPFTHTGVDFAGYFDIKISARRNAPFTKAYIAVFICLTTRAIHLEVVSSLSTEDFLLAFKRFTARKLLPRHMYSDRGTNFVGAKNELPRLFKQAQSEQLKEVRKALLNDQIEWHLIPAHAPHFGGMWEAAVKSTKYHLKRVLGDTKLNFEEFTTIVAQIESCLNSRPLYSHTEDPDDDLVITPNHLLFGHEAAAIPETCSHTIPANKMNRYQLLKRLHTEFWQRWSHDYLIQLMNRRKWTEEHENLRPGQIVVIKEDNLPPTKWLYGRILRVFPGKDGLVRVAEVQCKNSELTRPIHKLCLLPITDNDPTNSDGKL